MAMPGTSVSPTCIPRAAVCWKEPHPRAWGARSTAGPLYPPGRHGKYLFGGLDGDGSCLALHFGMTGRLQYLKQSESAPDAVQCLIEFDNGARLAYIATRKLGKISLCDTPESLIQDQKLGPDALDISAKDFVQLASGRRGAVKSWLMNQQIMAGIGNVYSDEILFQTGLHPRRSMEDMTEDDLKRLHAALRKVLEAAIDAQADPQQMPDDFLLPQRREGGHCPSCKGEPETLRVGGRTAWYCPDCQAH